MRATVAARIRAEKLPCPDHPMPLPKPSCWRCARNGAFERAARIALTGGSTRSAAKNSDDNAQRLDAPQAGEQR